YADREFIDKRNKYYHDLRVAQTIVRTPGALSYERERAAKIRRELDSSRKDLLSKTETIAAGLRDAVVKVGTDDQRASAGPLLPLRTSLDWINDLTTYGLIAMGFCLIAGLFTPWAALAGAIFLGQIYLSMPPWPGLPANPMAEGHYLIV